MSKSFDVNVSFNFRVVFSEEDLTDLQHWIAQRAANNAQHPADAHILKLHAEGDHEAIFQFLVKDSVKHMRQLILDEVPKSQFKNFSPFATGVKARG